MVEGADGRGRPPTLEEVATMITAAKESVEGERIAEARAKYRKDAAGLIDRMIEKSEGEIMRQKEILLKPIQERCVHVAYDAYVYLCNLKNYTPTEEERWDEVRKICEGAAKIGEDFETQLMQSGIESGALSYPSEESTRSKRNLHQSMMNLFKSLIDEKGFREVQIPLGQALERLVTTYIIADKE